MINKYQWHRWGQAPHDDQEFDLFSGPHLIEVQPNGSFKVWRRIEMPMTKKDEKIIRALSKFFRKLY